MNRMKHRNQTLQRCLFRRSLLSVFFHVNNIINNNNTINKNNNNPVNKNNNNNV